MPRSTDTAMGFLLAFFTDDQAAQLARISRRQLRYWRSTAVFLPEYPPDEEGALNSFRDLVALRTLGKLRQLAPLQELRKLGEWLHARYEAPWSTLRFSLAGREIVFEEPRTRGQYSARPSGQKLMRYEMLQIADELSEDVRQLFARRVDDIGKIDSKGRIQGTRIPAFAVYSFAREGCDDATIRREYPTITPEDVQAAIEYAKSIEAVPKKNAS